MKFKVFLENSTKLITDKLNHIVTKPSYAGSAIYSESAMSPSDSHTPMIEVGENKLMIDPEAIELAREHAGDQSNDLKYTRHTGTKTINGHEVHYGSFIGGRERQQDGMVVLPASDIPEQVCGEVLERTLQIMHLEVKSRMKQRNISAAESGATATLVLFDPKRKELHVASKGDSPAFAVFDDGNRAVAVQITSTEDSDPLTRNVILNSINHEIGTYDASSGKIPDTATHTPVGGDTDDFEVDDEAPSRKHRFGDVHFGHVDIQPKPLAETKRKKLAREQIKQNDGWLNNPKGSRDEEGVIKLDDLADQVVSHFPDMDRTKMRATLVVASDGIEPVLAPAAKAEILHFKDALDRFAKATTDAERKALQEEVRQVHDGLSYHPETSVMASMIMDWREHHKTFSRGGIMEDLSLEGGLIARDFDSLKEATQQTLSRALGFKCDDNLTGSVIPLTDKQGKVASQKPILVGVFDGFQENGHAVASIAARELESCLQESVEYFNAMIRENAAHSRERLAGINEESLRVYEDMMKPPMDWRDELERARQAEKSRLNR